MPPRVFTIPPSVPFLPALIDALKESRLVEGFAPASDALGFANATIFLPTRRACRLARDAFLEVLDVDAALLPRIVPIGDIDEDELVFADAATGGGALDALALPPALDGLERRFLLARLVRKWADAMALVTGTPLLVVRHPAAVLALADDLARLMDDMTTREVPWRRLDDLVPDQFDEYWKAALQFLKIAREEWPNLLDALGAIEPAARRDRLIAAEASLLAAASAGPVIAAGSTGSMPATAKLLATIASLPHGAVVLPGLDTELDEEAWNAIGGEAPIDGAPSAPAAPAPGHPQFAMHALLARIGITRRDVGLLMPPAPHGREILASEALRPAASTDQWRGRLAEPRLASAVAQGLDGITVIAAGNAEEEALAIAVALREALTEPTRTAALVTPDRALARRVAVMLQRWNVSADDSGGDKLADSQAGVFARLAAEAAFGGLAPAPLLALLKHKLARLGTDETRHHRAVAALERAVLRGPRPRPGSAGLAGALATLRDEIAKLRRGETSEVHFSDPRAALSEAALAEAHALADRIASALAPLDGLAAGSERHFAEIAARHREAVAALSADEAGAIAAFSGLDGEALAAAFDDIAEKVGAEPFDVAIEDYAEVFRLAIDDRVVRRGGAPGSRIRIYGLLEARLTGLDRVVIGGLTEGVWPPDPRTDAWLSRPMRQALGLDLPERRIGLSAHDFAQLLGAREVFLTHAVKLNGAPTVASRFLQRLAAVAGERLWSDAVARGERYKALARSLDAPRAALRPVGRPEPRPPPAARPKSLSVTEIEHWLRDPYTIYAKHVLKLPQLDPIDQRPGAAERGSVIHAAIGDFAKSHAEALPADPVAELLRLGALRFAPLDDFPEARAFWWPRFERIARWFADYEKTRRARMAAAHTEIRGDLAIATANGAFRLTGRADRIERRADGRYAIIDFKTGAPPSGKQVRIGIAPQLTLEAAMLRHGAFSGIPPGGTIAELVYVRLNGGDPPGREFIVDLKGRSADAVADEALAKLTALVRRFEDLDTPYRSLVLSMWTNRYGTYDDLARVKEWSLAGGAEDPQEIPGVQP
jgi:ATP-dependent helicase/nuclease subunit B